MDTLFTRVETARKNDNAPLAARMRPTTLDGYVGQAQAVGPGSWLRRAIEHDTLSSVILYGPAGTGKTTLARIIANSTHAEFVEVSAITGTVKDLRREIEAAESRLLTLGRRTILFVDEIHRFNRSQQDALLHAVEDRIVVLVGATTENPYFEVNSALISRSRVVELTALDDASVRELAAPCRGGAGGPCRALRALAARREDEIVTLAGGDGSGGPHLARARLPDGGRPAADGEGGPAPLVITREHVAEANPRRGLPYDKSGDMHYDVISAFIKSMRGSDPDAVLYWLARMLDAGEDPKFIARRIMICASEDIGNADPQALLVAHAAFQRHRGHRHAPSAASTWRRRPPTSPSRPRPTPQRRASTRALERGPAGSPPRGAQPPARPAPSRLRRATGPTSTRTTTRADGSPSATCPRGSSAGASTRRARAAGRPGGRRRSAGMSRTPIRAGMTPAHLGRMRVRGIISPRRTL